MLQTQEKKLCGAKTFFREIVWHIGRWENDSCEVWTNKSEAFNSPPVPRDSILGFLAATLTDLIPIFNLCFYFYTNLFSLLCTITSSLLFSAITFFFSTETWYLDSSGAAYHSYHVRLKELMRKPCEWLRSVQSRKSSEFKKTPTGVEIEPIETEWNRLMALLGALRESRSPLESQISWALVVDYILHKRTLLSIYVPLKWFKSFHAQRSRSKVTREAQD